jgi:hypothetical protein
MERDPKNYPGVAAADAPVDVETKAGMQAGYPYLSGHCPRCGRLHHVNAAGKALCECGNWLNFKDATA